MIASSLSPDAGIGKPRRFRAFWSGDVFPLIVVFASLMMTFIYFEERLAGWNANTRIALTYAIVEQGTFSIDRYHEVRCLQTGDKAYYDGHFYCDKSPGLSFLGVPTYWVLWTLKTRFGFLADKPNYTWVFWSRYIVRMSTVSIAAALLGALAFAMARRCGLSRRMAFPIGIGLLLGTFLFGYSTMFYSYLPACFFSLASYALIFFSRNPRAGIESPEERDLSHGSRLFWSGFLLGLGWLCEYTVGLLGIGLGFYTLWTVRRRWWTLWKYIVGGLISVVVFYSYTYAVFGEFSIPYKYEYDNYFRTEMAKGFQGIHLPRFRILLYITFHPFKGLFFYCPFLLLWFPALGACFRDTRLRRFRPDLILSIYIITSYFLLNSGYYMWWGGWAAGPRMLCPAIPFFLIPIVLYMRTPAKWLRIAFGALLAISLYWHLVITSVTPQAPTGSNDDKLRAGDISEMPKGVIIEVLHKGFYENLEEYSTFTNIPRLCGIKGLPSLIPILVFWALMAAWVVWGRQWDDSHLPPNPAGP